MVVETMPPPIHTISWLFFVCLNISFVGWYGAQTLRAQLRQAHGEYPS